MICLFGVAVACAYISTVATLPQDRALWAAAALGWAALAALAHNLG